MQSIILGAISGNAMVNALIYIVVAGLIWWILSWFISYVGIPEPFNKVARVVLAIIAVLMLVNGLLMLTGHPLVSWP